MARLHNLKSKTYDIAPLYGDGPERDQSSADDSFEISVQLFFFLERLFTGLRLVEGLDLRALDALCETDAATKHEALLQRYARDGFITWDGRRISLTDRGLELHTAIASALAA